MRLPGGTGPALLAALLFGVSTPLAKLLLGDLAPGTLAGLLYLGSGVGLTALRWAWRSRAEHHAPVDRSAMPWLAGAILFGGLLGPVPLMTGLRTTPASSAAPLLNLEGVCTALLAWFVFHENLDRRVAAGMALIVAGGLVLSWGGSGAPVLPRGALAVASACLCWAVDSNLDAEGRVSGPPVGRIDQGARRRCRQHRDRLGPRPWPARRRHGSRGPGSRPCGLRTQLGTARLRAPAPRDRENGGLLLAWALRWPRRVGSTAWRAGDTGASRRGPPDVRRGVAAHHGTARASAGHALQGAPYPCPRARAARSPPRALSGHPSPARPLSSLAALP